MYDNLLADINLVIASSAWTQHAIEVIPDNYYGKVKNPNEYARMQVLPTGSKQQAHGDQTTLSGLVAFKIFVKAGEGQKRVMEIANALDSVFKNKRLQNGTELGTSYVNMEGLDSQNPSLYSASYFIPFKHYGE